MLGNTSTISQNIGRYQTKEPLSANSFSIFHRYKILFLDVLFPLGIKKVAFIDADQIVRTDIQELFDLDLEGAPYGYTPFCSDRTEMDGFRFVRETLGG